MLTASHCGSKWTKTGVIVQNETEKGTNMLRNKMSLLGGIHLEQLGQHTRLCDPKAFAREIKLRKWRIVLSQLRQWYATELLEGLALLLDGNRTQQNASMWDHRKHEKQWAPQPELAWQPPRKWYWNCGQHWCFWCWYWPKKQNEKSWLPGSNVTQTGS